MSKVSELDALREANRLNIRAGANSTGKTYWAVVVLYNWVIYECDQEGETALHAVGNNILLGDKI